MEQKDSFYSQLKSLVVPIAIQSFMLSLVSATDALMLGLVDQASLSAVSLAGQIQFILSMFVMGISAGTGIMTAQYWGKKAIGPIERVIPIALRMNLLFGGMFTLMAAFAPGFLMSIYTNDLQLRELGAGYLRAVALSYVLCGVGQVYLTLLKNIGRAKKASLISSTAVVANIVLNGILIFGLFGAPKLGIVGAAYATVAARGIEVVWGMLEISASEGVKVRWSRLFRSAGELAKDFWRYTIPVLGAALVWGVAFSLYSVIMGHMGSDAVAANSITSIIKSMVSCLIRGVSAGAGIMVGNLLGANELDRAKVYGARLTKISIAVGAVTGVLMMLISPIIVKYANLSETAAGYMQYMMLFCGLNIMFQSVNTTVLDGIFCAGGDSKFDMYGNLIAMWSFSVPVGFLCAFVLKLPPVAVYCIVNSDEIVKIPAVYWRYKKYIWVRNITREDA